MMQKQLLLLALFIPITAVAQTEDVSREDTLREVTVTSRSAEKRISEVQIGVEKVEVATLAKVPALLGERDIVKSIQLLPGVKSEGEGSGGYQVRGGTSSQNLMLLDGATVYNAGHLMGLFSAFNDEALANASLYKGLVPAQLGGGTSSVFDIDTRSGDMQRYHFSGTMGLLSAKVMAEGPIRRDGSSFLFAGRRSYLDMFLKASKDYKDNTMNFYDMNVRLNFRLSPQDFLNLTFFRGRDNMGLDELMDMTWGNTTATANWLHTFSDRHYANTQLAYSDFGNDVGIDMMNIHYTMQGYHPSPHAAPPAGVDPRSSHRLNNGLESTYLQLQSAEFTLLPDRPAGQYHGDHEPRQRRVREDLHRRGAPRQPEMGTQSPAQPEGGLQPHVAGHSRHSRQFYVDALRPLHHDQQHRQARAGRPGGTGLDGHHAHGRLRLLGRGLLQEHRQRLRLSRRQVVPLRDRD